MVFEAPYEAGNIYELGTVLNDLTVSYNTPTFLTGKPFYITYDLTKRHFGDITDDISGTTLQNFYQRFSDSTYSNYAEISGNWVGGTLSAYKAPYRDPEHYAFEIFDSSQVNVKYLDDDLSANRNTGYTWSLTYCSDSGDIDTAKSTILYGSHADGVLTVDPSGQFPVSGYTTATPAEIAGLASYQYIYYLIHDKGLTGIPDPLVDASWGTFVGGITAFPALATTLTEAEFHRLNEYDDVSGVLTRADITSAVADISNMKHDINTNDGTVARDASYNAKRFSQTIDSTTGWDVSIAGGSGTGDPYITTFGGITYKMDDFTGYARMLQGTLDNKLFTINAETNLLTKEELTDLIIMRNKMNIKMGANAESRSHLCNDKFPAYFTKLYVQWGNDIMVIDLKEHKIISDTRNENYEVETCDTKEYSWSNKRSNTNKMLIPFGDVTLVVKKFANLDLRSGFTVLNHSKIKNRTGALENTLYTKDIKLKKLNTLTPLKRVENRQPKRMSKETFNESETFSRIVELPVF